MAIIRLALTDFRSHAAQELAAGPGLVVLHGANGAGKTNILEALSLLTPGRGLRGAALPDMVRDGTGAGFSVFADWQGGDGAMAALGTGVSAERPTRRQVRINGAAAAASSLAEWLAVLWLTPAMDRLFQESAGGRRRFLDRLVLALEPGHALHAGRLEAALRARGKLLTDPRGYDQGWMAALESQIGDHGAAVDAARQRTLAALDAELLARAGEGDDGFPLPCAGLTDSEGNNRTAAWNSDDLAEMLAQRRNIDSAAGRTTRGPHRDDLTVCHAATGRAAARCSTGEQKGLLLSLILAHADCVARLRGNRPLLLLDEVAAHLDPGRRAALYRRLAAAGGQCWLTGTEAGLFDGMEGVVTRFALSAQGVTRL
jgi:DNA replication and repair protein RecF